MTTAAPGFRAMRVTVLLLVVVRLVLAATTPLSFDEAYYWTWSKHLAAGYYDHPPMVALVIRLGTAIAGDTEFGVRLISVLLTIPMSWAIFRAAAILFSEPVAIVATLLLNSTLIVHLGTLIVTPDAPLLVASSFLLYMLANLLKTGRPVWWLGVGAMAGLALLSKYTALLFGPCILLWLLVVPDLRRRWLPSPWPYLGALLALAIFAPVIVWNADNHWISFLKQFGRARVEDFSLRFLPEFVPIQFVFANPLVFIPGVAGLALLLRRDIRATPTAALINALFWPIVIYFCWHSLHSRVEGNWLAPVYPAFAIAGGYALCYDAWSQWRQRTHEFCARWAAPVAAAISIVLAVQATTGILTGYRRDVTARQIGAGLRTFAGEIEEIREQTNATCVLAGDYGRTAWLMFYMPKGTCVLQRNERYRWNGIAPADPELLRGRLLLVDEIASSAQANVRANFEYFELITELVRMRGPESLQVYQVDLLEGAKGDPLDTTPPPELQ